ncbi:hypothetical protein ACFPES_25550 [Paenibacillus sp. GCM10023248]|uniref:hypothetical protein n=1 Tax=unclassified Paenibacillus TaxID=185978 RepID=UPI002379E90D|nr:hypothetical protein [Paenibacillus sp. MAHUQ-63]MDD9270427.1 hypothetical protein [Paenibacillus sp. MAHUQ-63]
MKFRAVSEQTRMNYMMWSIKKEIQKENAFLNSLPYDPTPILEVVNAHLDAWDPLQLLAMDGPEDEYEGEARSITIYIANHLTNLNEQLLSQGIRQVFTKSFGDEFQEHETLADVAASVLRALRSLHIVQ